MRKFRISDCGDTTMEVVVAIDPAIVTEAIAHELNDFWADKAEALDEADGDVYVAVAKRAGRHAMGLMLEELSEDAAWIDRKFKRQEGWLPEGVTIAATEGLPYLDDVHVTEITPTPQLAKEQTP